MENEKENVKYESQSSELTNKLEGGVIYRDLFDISYLRIKFGK